MRRFLSYTRSATVSVAPVGVPPTGSGCVEDGTQLCVRAPRECFRRDADAEYVFSVVGTSCCDVRAACSGATPSIASVARIFVPPATTRAGTAQRAIPTIALNTYDAENCGRDDRAPHFYPRELGRTRLHSATSSSSARLNTDWMAASSSCAPKGFQSIRPPISWMKVSYLGSAR